MLGIMLWVPPATARSGRTAARSGRTAARSGRTAAGLPL
jgi:hypothetical protein